MTGEAAALQVGAIEAAQALAPALEARASEAEELRRLPESSFCELEQSGFLSLLTPTSVGGSGAGLATVAQATRELAHGCPATAWTASFFAIHSWILAHFPAAACEEAFAGGSHCPVPAALAPTGGLEKVDGGYKLSGRWSYATGVMHSDWAIVTGILDRDGRIEPRFCLLPQSDVTVVDVWHMAGMQATGSNDIVVDDVFVPEHRTIATFDLATGIPTSSFGGASMMSLPLQPVLVLTAAAPALGAAERAYGLFLKRMRDRVLAYSLGDKQADQPASQVRLATAKATILGARSAWEATIAKVESHHGTDLPLDIRAESRLIAAHTVAESRRAIDIICSGAGASAYQQSSPLQRLQRDVETLKGHVVFDWDRTAELYGRVELGLPRRPADML